MTHIMLQSLPLDMINYHIVPVLSELDVFCLDIVLRRQRLFGKEYFPERIHELLIKEGMHRYQYFNKLGMLDTTASMNYAAKYGQLDILQHGKEHKYVFNNKAINNAAEYDHLECIKFLLTCGLFCSGNTVIAAARGGHLHIVKYVARKHKGKNKGDQKDAVIAAAKHGHLEVFTYLTSLLYKIDCFRDSFDAAVIGGHIPVLSDILTRAYDINMYYTHRGYDLAIKHKQYDVLVYSITRWKYPQAYNIAVQYNDARALQILYDNNVQLPYHPMLLGANEEVLTWFEALRA